MSVQLFVGPSGAGKTFFMREFLIPALLTVPAEVTRFAPAEGFSAALIADPPTVEWPQGQYEGPWYTDVAEWRRAERRSRVARFRRATVNALCDVGQRYGRLVICLDDMERDLGSESRPSAEALEVITRGRLHGCVLLGACRRMMAVHTSVRSNVETIYFGGLTDKNDRDYAAKTAGVPLAMLEALGNIKADEHVLLEWRCSTGERSLVTVRERQRLIIQRC